MPANDGLDSLHEAGSPKLGANRPGGVIGGSPPLTSVAADGREAWEPAAAGVLNSSSTHPRPKCSHAWAGGNLHSPHPLQHEEPEA